MEYRPYAMVRPIIRKAHTMTTWKISRIPIDAGGYDPDGRYFGVGLPLYSAECDDESDTALTFRASDAAAAREHVSGMFPNVTFAADESDAEDFIAGYFRALFFTEAGDPRDEKEIPPDASLRDMAPESQAKCESDCRAFLATNRHLLDEDTMEQGGMNFWLTRNGHGAGFFDGDYPTNGDALTAACRSFGEVWAYMGDDGKIYVQ